MQFGDCVLDSETRELTRLGERTHLSPKAFLLVELLLERRPKALSKDQIHGLLWPRTFVTDTALTTLVKEARGAIGDNGRAPRFVRTVPGLWLCLQRRGLARARKGSDGHLLPPRRAGSRSDPCRFMN